METRRWTSVCRHLITDAHGMRYLVPRSEELDAKSRKLLSAFA